MEDIKPFNADIKPTVTPSTKATKPVIHAPVKPFTAIPKTDAEKVIEAEKLRTAHRPIPGQEGR